MTEKRFQRYAWGFLLFTVLVILWGALVRATGSGAGCGAHWPLCNGMWVPTRPAVATLIELTHRAMSGLSLLGAGILVIWGFRQYPRGSPIRRAALWTLIFLLAEAMIGAGLVLLKLVEHNASALRALYLSVHLTNTFLLLAALASCVWWAGRPARVAEKESYWRGLWGYGLGGLGLLAVGVSGGIAALGDTLFPSRSLAEGFAQDFSPTSHFLIMLRGIHPIGAIVVGLYLLGLGAKGMLDENAAVRKGSEILLGLVLAQWAIGAWNLLALAPVVLQLIHLALADALWIAWVMLSWTAWAARPAVSIIETSPPFHVSS